ncbi:MAG TPA: GNAT family N-acetyltransferase [Gaiellaceae bacterium]|jgi:GNAT superfamily N-acetyltransferase
MIELLEAETDADLEAWRQVKLRVLPGERAPTVEELRAEVDRLFLLAHLDGALAGSGLSGPSDAAGRGFLTARVLPEHRRRGVGTALVHGLEKHCVALGFRKAGVLVDGADEGSVAFARRFGFEERRRDVEQVRFIGDEKPPPPPPEGVEMAVVAERPGLLRDAYGLATEGYADMALDEELDIPREQWLREEATLPEASFVALSDGEIIGYAGLLEWPGDPTRAEHGLTVVRRAWRGRGVAPALKRRQISWASANGLRELVTWTQRGNENMRRVNERLGYQYRGLTLAMIAPLPLRRP